MCRVFWTRAEYRSTTITTIRPGEKMTGRGGGVKCHKREQDENEAQRARVGYYRDGIGDGRVRYYYYYVAALYEAEVLVLYSGRPRVVDKRVSITAVGLRCRARLPR